jgi:crooked neck
MAEQRGPPRVKNKAAAPVQISAEQLLREAVDRQDAPLKAPTQRFADLEELKEHQGRKRKEFEDYVRRNRINMNNWMRYASWELEQKEFRRARSIFERALDVDSTSVALWLRYIESEAKHRNVQHARNLLDRAVTILPRVDKLWYKYVYMEETLGNIDGARSVFERWMQWEPEEAAWSSYIKLEKRHGEFERCRAIYERFTVVHPEPKNWIKWAKFEEENGTSDLVRDVYGTAVTTLGTKPSMYRLHVRHRLTSYTNILGDEFMDEKLFMAYAKFEARLKELERARAIYKFALDRMPRSKSVNLHKAFTTFEKQYGDRDGIEDVILSKRRVHYENELKENSKNYDAWIDFARLEETAGNQDRVRDVYERAIAQIPPTQEKRHWRRYIYL